MAAVLAAASVLAAAPAAHGQAALQPPQVLRVAALAAAPVIDGVLGEWSAEGWTKIEVKPAVEAGERAGLGLDAREVPAPPRMRVEIKAGMAQGRIFFAVRWPDAAPDTDYRLWERKGSEYVEGSQRDDAFAVRFAMQGEFDRTMLSGKSYTVDVWYWSAGRSNRVGRAEDMMHRISSRFIEDAAEYQVRGVGTVYIKKTRDAGTPLYRNLRPAAEAREERLPSIAMNPQPAGSIADVQARGVWSKGAWHLELARALDTGHADDVVLRPGARVPFQIAVFNRSGDENKGVSEPLLLDLGALP